VDHDIQVDVWVQATKVFTMIMLLTLTIVILTWCDKGICSVDPNLHNHSVLKCQYYWSIC
jgi:hypothetical protein